jgi:uncharacterized protein
MRSLVRIILAFIFIYLVVMVVYYFIQRDYIYLPHSGDMNPKVYNLPSVKLIKLKTSDGLSLSAWYHPAKNTHMPTMLYLQGNTGHLAHRAFRIRPFIKAGYGILLLGYRGYGGNEGEPTEKGLYIDARTAMFYLMAEHIPMHCIVIYGESLGSGIAVQMATEFKVGAIILQSPYTSLMDVARNFYPILPTDLLLRDRYESIKKIQKIQTPLFILHGEKDKIIPVNLGQALYSKALEPKEIKLYEKRGHTNLPDVSGAVIQFLKKHQICS